MSKQGTQLLYSVQLPVNEAIQIHIFRLMSIIPPAISLLGSAESFINGCIWCLVEQQDGCQRQIDDAGYGYKFYKVLF